MYATIRGNLKGSKFEMTTVKQVLKEEDYLEPMEDEIS